MRLVTFVLALVWAGAGFAETCTRDVVDIRSQGNIVRFNVEVVDNFRMRALGLMHRESLPKFAGMLFVYEKPQSVNFWMRNTLIPLDMLFIDETGTVKKIHENAVPLSEDHIPGGQDILEVLEINGGLAKTLGLKAGAVIRHPSLDMEKAAWPCDEVAAE